MTQLSNLSRRAETVTIGQNIPYRISLRAFGINSPQLRIQEAKQ